MSLLKGSLESVCSSHVILQMEQLRPRKEASYSGLHETLMAGLGLEARSPALALLSVTTGSEHQSRPRAPGWAACRRQAGRQGGGRLWFQAEVNIDMSVFTL